MLPWAVNRSLSSEEIRLDYSVSGNNLSIYVAETGETIQYTFKINGDLLTLGYTYINGETEEMQYTLIDMTPEEFRSEFLPPMA